MRLYLDMDGVIADFFTLFAEENKVTHWKSISCKEQALANIRGTDFFNRIKPFPISDELIKFAKNFATPKTLFKIFSDIFTQHNA